MSSSARVLVLAAACLVATANAIGEEWSESKPGLYRGDIVITYRARVAGEWLIVEATHKPNWHTYAMDNLTRAQKASGKESPEVEAPTQIAVRGGLEVAGPWKQSAPADLSNRDIRWFTWGFSDIARFAVKLVKKNDEPAVVTINAQLCSDSLCSFVRDLEIVVPRSDADESADAASLTADLIDVATEGAK